MQTARARKRRALPSGVVSITDLVSDDRLDELALEYHRLGPDIKPILIDELGGRGALASEGSDPDLYELRRAVRSRHSRLLADANDHDYS